MCTARSCTCPNGIDQCLNGGTFNNATCTCSCPSGFTGTVCEAKSCQNSGTFNNVTNTCTCFPNYGGANCQNLNCSISDPPLCSLFSTAHCSILLVNDYCPTKCGKCAVTTTTTVATSVLTTAVTQTSVVTFQTTTSTTTTTSTSTSTTTTTSTTPANSCTPVTCSNGFTFNAATCACQCGAGFSGILCQNYKCAFTPVPDAPVCSLSLSLSL